MAKLKLKEGLPEKISSEHLEKIQKIVNIINGIQFNIGKLEARKHELLHDYTSFQDKITLFQDTLQKEYGTYDVNLDDGTINYPKPPEDEK